MTQDLVRLHAKSPPADPIARNLDRPVSWLVRQLFTRLRGRIPITTAVLAAALAAGCRQTAPEPSAPRSAAVARGGEIVASVRSEPATFNRHFGRDSTTNLVSLLTHARLVRVN